MSTTPRGGELNPGRALQQHAASASSPTTFPGASDFGARWSEDRHQNHHQLLPVYTPQVLKAHTPQRTDFVHVIHDYPATSDEATQLSSSLQLTRYLYSTDRPEHFCLSILIFFIPFLENWSQMSSLIVTVQKH